jgi:tetratricopeptide (TPR) repeat protein
MKLIFYITLIGLFFTLAVSGQNLFYYEVLYKVKDIDNNPLKGATVKILDNETSKTIDTKLTDAEGAAKFVLDVKQGITYRVEISKYGFITFKMLINSKIPGIEGLAKAVYTRKFVINLNKGDMADNQIPISRRIIFLPNIKDFDDDPNFKPENASLSNKKEILPSTSANENIAKYNEALKNGNDLLKQNKLPEAKAAFNQALAAKPNDKIASDRIAEIDKKLKAKEDKENFDKLMDLGNKLLAAKKLNQAKDKFLEALEIFPEDKGALQKIADINAELVKNDSNKKNKLKAMQTLDLAKGLIKQNKLPEAKLKLMEVLDLDPDNKEAQIKLKEVDKKIAEESKPKYDENKFKELVAKGDKNVQNESYPEAIRNYMEALKLKPKDKQVEAKQNDAQQKLQLKGEKLYKDAIRKADGAFKNNDYEIAQMQYKMAAEIKPNEIYPKNKLKELEKVLANIAKTTEEINSIKKDRNSTEELNYLKDKKLKEEKLKALAQQREVQVQKNKNLNTKYQTENPITKLYNAVDEAEKNNIK